MAKYRPTSDWTAGDGVGIACAAICLVHCVVVSMLFFLAPWILRRLGPSRSLHQTFAFLSLFIALATLLPGYQIHHRRHVLVFGGIGVAFLLVGALIPQDLCCNLQTALNPINTATPTPVNLAATALTPVGCCLLVAAHLINRRCCQSRRRRTRKTHF